jgi:mono/diheme cytochrome c family protein
MAVERTAMTRKQFVPVALSLALLVIVTGTAVAGGWAIITLSGFPEYAVAGKPLKLSFAVRQHGVTLLSGLRPNVRAATPSGLTATANAVPAKEKGEYTAELLLPQHGNWTITVVSGFNDSQVTLPPLKVIEAGTAAPAAFSPATRGVRLFASKGCVGCHRHIEVNPERATDAKFDLTGKRFPQEYLKKFLADPSIKPAEMPNLNLKSDEIDALAAFINKLVSKTAPSGR